MKCLECGFENLAGMKFCGQCGSKLELICVKCSTSNPPQFKFCGECGHNLTSREISAHPKVLSLDDKLSTLQGYLPEGRTQAILARRDRIEGERRHVTVMFCDMKGFTSLVEKLGPEDSYLIVEKMYDVLIRKVHQYHGTVNELTGDGIMALFGAPIALEDAPQRAIRAALSIHLEMTRFSDKMKGLLDMKQIQMRVGIHTGPVVVGTVKNDLRVEFKAVGDTVNLASRMEGLAEPGTTYVTEDTYRITEGLFRCEALGEKDIKGKARPIKVYQVIAPSSRRTRFDVSAERGLTPFVGRERELALLLDGFERSKEGMGQAISIVGEAGVGKSRLLYEFRKAIANEDVTLLEGRCLSYSGNVAYHPVIDILKSNFDIVEEEEESKTIHNVRKSLKVLGVDDERTVPFILDLLSIKNSGIGNVPASMEERKEKITSALKRIVIRGSEIRPLVMAVEDLHWSDKASEEFTKHMLDSITGSRIFLILTYRPEFVPTWGGKSYHSQITLNRLSNRESLTMTNNLLGNEEADSRVQELILKKTEGVPFFIEEFIRSLKEMNLIKKTAGKYRLTQHLKDLAIPSTIQDVIMARVDSLPMNAKGVLQTGSAIEREFSYELIKRVTGLVEKELLTYLSVLKDSELLYERGVYPQSTHVFRHALTRDVVYNSMLAGTKKQLHLVIAQAIEGLYSKSIYEHSGLLAEHYISGENYEKGSEYARLSGRQARKAGSIHDAVHYAKKRVDCLQKMPMTDDVETKLIDARTALGLYMVELNYMSEAKDAVDPIVDVAIRRGYKKKLSQIYTILGTHKYWIEEDFESALKYMEEAYQIANQEGDFVALGFASFWLGAVLSFICRFEEAANYMGNALAIGVAANNPSAISTIKGVLGVFPHFFQGRIDHAYRTSCEAVPICHETADINAKAWAHAGHGIACYGIGLLEDAIDYLLKAVGFCEGGNIFICNALSEGLLAEIYAKQGHYEKSKDHFEKAADLAHSVKMFPSWEHLYKIGLSLAKVLNDEKEIDLDFLAAGVNSNKIKIHEGCMRRYMGEILLNIGDQPAAEAKDWIEQAIEADQRNGMMFHLGRDYALYAELLRRQGDKLRAKEHLGKAIEIYKECGADGWVTKTEEEMAKL